MGACSAERIIRPKRRRRRSGPVWWLRAILYCLSVAALIGGVLFGIGRIEELARPRHIAGYVSGLAILQDEYRTFYGDVLQSDAAAARIFAEADAQAASGKFRAALASLERMSREAAVPCVFTDMGLLALRVGDDRMLEASFQQVLERQPSYTEPAQYGKELGPLLTRLRAAVTSETEPNDTKRAANRIPTGQAIDAQIANRFDTDLFRLLSPPGTRDILRFEVDSKSKDLQPALKVFDADWNLVDGSAVTGLPGANLEFAGALPPNRVIYVQVVGENGTTGAYSLLVSPAHAFDQYEPNDSPAAATTVRLGSTIHASIMDPLDRDYYVLESAGATSLNVEFTSGRSALRADVQILGPDRSRLAAMSAAKGTREDQTYHFTTQAGRRYYIEVSAQENTFGEYSLRIE